MTAEQRFWSEERETLFSWMMFKIMLGIGWTHAMFLVTPASIASAVSANSVNLWTLGTALGAMVSILSMVISLSENPRRSVWGYNIELLGIILLAGGPAQYMGVQVGFLIADWQEAFSAGRYPLAWFAASMLVPITIRARQIVRKRQRKVALMKLEVPFHDSE